ncbi:AAA family ATPase [Hymenobacter pini]|uniref:AAA family ATPase n=1 Tax=Hymenobacter pini TaxID=2880879 RepID=UPI001CF0DF68|nr:ATP-binding protein [Hymenobacter pini]MCA8831969.1 AAA family ATPase [Hymenobacter pini]
MRISEVRLKEFRRFTDLTITGIPATARLVVLVGPNGSGKSSLFDGFNAMATVVSNNFRPIEGYYSKAGYPSSGSHWGIFEQEKINVNFYDSHPFNWRNSDNDINTRFYIRTGYRYEPDFTLKSLARLGDVTKDEGQPRYMMSLETRVSSNYQRLVAQAVSDIFEDTNGHETKAQIRERLIGKIRDSFNRVLPGAILMNLGDPLSNGNFYFTKGSSSNWSYKNLSAGEKAAFDLVLDFAIKSSAFNNTVYCIDEPEVHVNTNVHGALLEELYRSLPGESQLWIATHSAGMMRKARELEVAHPGTVVFLDFGEHDFDQPVVMRPAVTNRAFWQRNFQIAIGDMANLVAPTQVFFCEGDPNGTKKKEFDARCYTGIFANEFPDAVFLSVGSSNEVKDKAALLGGVFSQFLPGVQTTFVVDRDDCTEPERQEIIAQGNKILSRRHLEAYLLDEEILEKFCQVQGQPEQWPTLQAERAQALQNSSGRGNPSDDWKSVGEHIRQAARRLLRVTQIGSNSDAFMIDHLVPLVTPDTQVYQELKRDIFG